MENGQNKEVINMHGGLREYRNSDCLLLELEIKYTYKRAILSEIDPFIYLCTIARPQMCTNTVFVHVHPLEYCYNLLPLMPQISKNVTSFRISITYMYP